MWNQGMNGGPGGAPPPPPPAMQADAPGAGQPMMQQMPMQGGMMQPGMMMPQAMMPGQQMFMPPWGMMPPGPPAQDAAADAKPAVMSTEGRKKAAEYQRLMQKGDNAETVFVGGLRKSTDEDQIAAHFAKFGQVEKVDLKKQPDGTSRGFAFVRFCETGSVDRVIEKRASHMIDNKWIDVKKHSGTAACAGRAQALTTPAPKEEDDEPDPNDLEEKWTNQYLTMAQQVQENFGAVEENEEPEPAAPAPAQQPMMAMMQPMQMGGQMPMGMGMMPQMPMPSQAPQEGQELMVTGFMTLSPSVLAQMGISGGPPGLIVGVPILSNGQPAVPIPGMMQQQMQQPMGPPGMMQQALPGGGPGMPAPGSFGAAPPQQQAMPSGAPGLTARPGPY